MGDIFDSHAHYFDARFAAETEGAAPLLRRLFAERLCGVLNVGTDLANSRQAIFDAREFPRMYVAVGIHPTDGQRYDDLAAAMGELRALLSGGASRRENKIVAIGEIGLDYHYPDTDKEKQAFFFDAQLSLAEELGLPVVIHDRDAHGDCFETILRHPGARGVFHSFSGSAEMARELLRRGWYISFSGVVTFKNAPRVREAVAAVPLDRLLIETDAPYLAPSPHRGEVNHSGYLTHTAAAIAAVKGTTEAEICRVTAENARKLFSIG